MNGLIKPPVNLRINNDGRLIKMDFGATMSSMEMTPIEAIGLADILLQNALVIVNGVVATQTAQTNPKKD